MKNHGEVLRCYDQIGRSFLSIIKNMNKIINDAMSKMFFCTFHLLTFTNFFTGYHFPERLSDLLIRQVRGGSEADRVAALTVISHLLGSSDSVLSLRMSDLINALHVLSDASVKVCHFLS